MQRHCEYLREPGRGPQNPMSDAELRAKFDDCAHASLSEATADALWQHLCRFESVADVATVAAVCVPGEPAAAAAE